MSQTDQFKTVEELVKAFEQIVLGPGMYVGRTDEAVDNFLI
jgi:hypothetical protein